MRQNLLLTFLLLTGCHYAAPAEQLPVYVWTDAPTALHALCQRSQVVNSVSSECALTLTRGNGESVRLDGAIVMRLADSVRMRAWKFGQAVFDLTLTPAGLWIEGPKDASRRDEVLPASLDAARMARAWSIISGQFFCSDDARVEDHGGASFIVEKTIDAQRIRCQIERATLTPRKYTIMDAGGIDRFTLTLDRYELISGIAWPVHLTAHSDGGSISIELKDPELNGELAPNAFTPPRTAEKMP
jgi:hypothetical protein